MGQKARVQCLRLKLENSIGSHFCLLSIKSCPDDIYGHLTPKITANGFITTSLLNDAKKHPKGYFFLYFIFFF
jgi:hypothetical protein